MNIPKTWNREEIIKAMRLCSPNQALTRQAYLALRQTHGTTIPSIYTISEHFHGWIDFRHSVWGIGQTTWTKERCIQALKDHCQEPVGFDNYAAFSKGKRELPSTSALYRHFKSWDELSVSVWGVTKAWTRERIEQVLKQHFKKAPTSRELTELAATHPEVPTIHYCEKAFGSYAKMQEAVFNQPASEQFDKEKLIQLMRQQFSSRPKNFNAYHELTKTSVELPTVEDYIYIFGSWGNAMLACYPEATKPKRRSRWNEANTLDVLRLAYADLGDSLDVNTYQAWAANRDDAPGLTTIILCWGKFSTARTMAQRHPIPVAS